MALPIRRKIVPRVISVLVLHLVLVSLLSRSLVLEQLMQRNFLALLEHFRILPLYLLCLAAPSVPLDNLAGVVHHNPLDLAKEGISVLQERNLRMNFLVRLEHLEIGPLLQVLQNASPVFQDRFVEKDLRNQSDATLVHFRTLVVLEKQDLLMMQVRRCVCTVLLGMSAHGAPPILFLVLLDDSLLSPRDRVLLVRQDHTARNLQCQTYLLLLLFFVPLGYIALLVWI